MKIVFAAIGAVLLLASMMGSNELTRAFTVAAVLGSGLIVKKALPHPNRTRILVMSSLIAVGVSLVAIAMVPHSLGAFQLGELFGSALGSWAISICAILLIVRAVPNTVFKETQ